MSIEQVFSTLSLQTERMRYLAPLEDGQLKYFRTALEMESFPEVVQRAKGELGCDLFSTLEEITSMEESYQDGCGFELVVQCCLIVELELIIGISEDGPSLNQRTSLFRQCRTLEEIASLRSRLIFIREPTHHQRGIDLDFYDAVRRCVMDSDVITWRGMLLVLSVARRIVRHWVLFEFYGSLEGQLNEMPKAAATLFLSYASEAFEHDRSASRGDMILKLLSVGASPMVSFGDHEAAFKVLQRNHPSASGESWLLNGPRSKYRNIGRGPSALRRIVAQDPSKELMQQLSRHVCCHLDVATTSSTRVFPTKVPSLACLAIRHVKDSDSETLPARMRFTMQRHRPTK